MIPLRYYQSEAVDAAYNYLRDHEADRRPLISLPTGAGKSVCIAKMCIDTLEWGDTALVLSPSKELVVQVEKEILKYAPGSPVGIYCAGLGRKEMNKPITLATIQSIYQQAFKFDRMPSLVLPDECHLISPDDETRYKTFFNDLQVAKPDVRVVGLTGSPYRLKGGLIYGPDKFFSDICYEAYVKELILQGFLCPLKSRAGTARADVSNVSTVAGEFNQSEMAAAHDQDALVQAAVKEIVEAASSRNKVLIFAASRSHGRHVVDELLFGHGITAGYVDGETDDAKRSRTVEEFRDGGLKYLVNVECFTTGFDVRSVDCVALLFSTKSPVKLVQCVGRAFRVHDSKRDALILDFGGNIERLGPVDAIRIKDKKKSDNGDAPAKECPTCRTLVPAGVSRCPECDHEFPPAERAMHGTKASGAAILSGEVSDDIFEVLETTYHVHKKKNAEPGTPLTMRVQYTLPGLHRYANEWVCVSHPENSFARRKAREWWVKRCKFPMPDTVEEAVEIGKVGGFAKCSKITVRTTTGEQFPRIINWELGPIPDPNGPRIDGKEEAVEEELDEIPF